MGRPSKLTEKQWLEIERRHLNGESGRKLASEFKVSEAAIRKRVSTQSKQIKAVANQIIATEQAINELPLSAQLSAHNLANKLRAISEHLAGAGTYGAMTAHKLSLIANTQAEQIDEAASIGENEGAIKSVLAMTRGANDAAQIGLNLLAANKGTMEDIKNEGERKKAPSLSDFYGET